MGPLLSWQPTIPSISIPEDIDAYLKNQESQFNNMTPDTEKKIFWANPETKEKTHYSLIYFHGFSATRQDLSPTFEDLAKNLGANLFMTRLKGHGLGPEGFADVTAQDWIQDAHEALLIGNRIGENVIVAGDSSGAVLGIHLAHIDPKIFAQILISPNFKVNNPLALFASGPLGPLWARLLIGPYRSFHPENVDHEKYWTTRYRVQGVSALMDLLKYISHLDFTQIHQPTLVIYSDRDAVVSTEKIKSRFEEFGTQKKELVLFNDAENAHVISGRILSPKATAPIVQKMTEFLREAMPTPQVRAEATPQERPEATPQDESLQPGAGGP